MRLREHLGRCAVAAANVADDVAWHELEPVGDQVDQRSGGILGSSRGRWASSRGARARPRSRDRTDRACRNVPPRLAASVCCADVSSGPRGADLLFTVDGAMAAHKSGRTTELSTAIRIVAGSQEAAARSPVPDMISTELTIPLVVATDNRPAAQASRRRACPSAPSPHCSVRRMNPMPQARIIV